MRVLMAHNYYLQAGGEDTVFEAEVELLQERGHEVIEYIEHNEAIRESSAISTAARTMWSRPSYNAIKEHIRKGAVEIAHFHNIFPLISPAGYYACANASIPVVQTLYNPRLLCPAASLYRNGGLCTDCVGRLPWSGVLHACYHHSRIQTLAVASMLVGHRLLGTWDRRVTLYLVATDFYRRLMIRGGLPANKILVKPNFVHNAPNRDKASGGGNYALFVGRLDPEKGVRTLLNAWRTLGMPLIIRGGGQLEGEAREYIVRHGLHQVSLVERVSRDDLLQLMEGASFLVWPSEGYYETFGLAAVEAFAAGIPVVASRIGVMEEIVHEMETGVHFNPGDPGDLAAKVQWLWDHPEEARRMGKNARREYEEKYTPERNYQMLMDIYQRAIDMNRR